MNVYVCGVENGRSRQIRYRFKTFCFALPPQASLQPAYGSNRVILMQTHTHTYIMQMVRQADVRLRSMIPFDYGWLADSLVECLPAQLICCCQQPRTNYKYQSNQYIYICTYICMYI